MCVLEQYGDPFVLVLFTCFEEIKIYLTDKRKQQFSKVVHVSNILDET